jgi:hypothetical protein
MPIIRAQFRGRHGGLLGGLFSRRGLGCPCEQVSQPTLGQDPYFNPATGSDTFNPTTLQPVATDVIATPTATGYSVPTGTSLTPAASAALTSAPALPTIVATPTSIGASAAGSLNDFIYNIDTTWYWVGGAAILGLFLWKKKKR